MTTPWRTRYVIDHSVPPIRGGQGIIYEARDVHLQRRVMLKRPQEGLTALPSGCMRFEREALVTAGLQHPGIVPIYDYFEDDDEVPWCAMELVSNDNGPPAKRALTLDDLYSEYHGWRCRRHDATFRHLIRILIRIAAAISYAHRSGLIHRDLKCRNVLVTDSRVVVIDWGLVRVANLDDLVFGPTLDSSAVIVDDQLLTHDGEQIGTPPYSAPEQRVDASRADERSDVYSLGVMLYRVLMQGELPAADARPSLDKLRASHLPRDLVAICRTAMSEQPEQRYATAAAMRRDLEHWLNDLPVSVSFNLVDSFWRVARRYRTLASIGLTSALIALVYLGIFNYLNSQRAAELSRANTELDDAVAANQQLAYQAKQQLSLIRERQYSSTLREASTLIVEHDPQAARELLDDVNLCADSDREFTWRLLRDRVERIQYTTRLNVSPRRIAFLHVDGSSSLLVGDVEGRLSRLSMPELCDLGTLLDTTAPISALATHQRNGEVLIGVGNRDGEVIVLRPDGQVMGKLDAHDHPVRLVGFELHSGTLVTADRQGVIKTWPSLSEAPAQQYELHEQVSNYAYSPHRNLIAAGGRHRMLNVVNLNKKVTHPLESNWAGAITFMERGNRLATSTFTGHMQIWDTSGDVPRFVKYDEAFKDIVRQYEVLHTREKQIVVASTKEDGVHVSSSGPSGFLPIDLRLRRYDAKSLDVSVDGQYVAFSYGDDLITLWNLQPLHPSKRLTLNDRYDFLGHELVDLAWSTPLSNEVLLAATDGSLSVWNFESGMTHNAELQSSSPVVRVVADHEIDRLLV
ncbi:MAG: protein kinase, partial [Planctomycetales bacterium]|nr:protein kinase [Planctomycetales bacterium]